MNLKMRGTCARCGPVELNLVLTPELKHYGKYVCGRCGRFINWAPRPAVPPERLRPPAVQVRGAVARLEGSPAQISFAMQLRAAMISRAREDLPENVYNAVLMISDAAWWIGNKDRAPRDYRWPKDWLPDAVPGSAMAS